VVSPPPVVVVVPPVVADVSSCELSSPQPAATSGSSKERRARPRLRSERAGSFIEASLHTGASD
jgi:hypothetical protein